MEGLDFEIPKGLTLPKGHAEKDLKDFGKCPYGQMGKGPAGISRPKETTKDKKDTKDAKDAKDSDSEEEAPKGGCPVMTSDKNKNPPLAPFGPNFKYSFLT